jgi:hypothetical protein
LTDAVWTRSKALPIFVILQCLDVLTTLVFLNQGTAEGNPLLVWALPHAHAPWIGLVAAKLLAGLIGLYCYRNGRIRTLRIANTGYSLMVGWNLTAIAAAAIAR